MAISDEFLDKTIKMFQPHYKEQLTREDAREIIENMVGFFEVLLEWDREEKERLKNLQIQSKYDPESEMGGS